MEKKFCIYKITNLKNNKIYVGAHSTKDLNDSYMGSGLAIKEAIQKHGKQYFKKEIIEVLFSETEMYQREAEIVTTDFIKRSDTYNMIKGGHVKPPENLGKSVTGSIWINDGEHHRRIPATASIPEGWKRGRASGSIKGRIWITNGVKSKRIDPSDSIPEGWWQESRQKKNPWYTNGEVDMKIKDGDPIPEGFHKGRSNSSNDQTSSEYRQRKSKIMKESWARRKQEESTNG